MTDAKKPGPIDDIDWDEALAEWEGKGLAPEVAAEIPDASAPERPTSRRLYRPPSVPPPPLAAPAKVPRPPPPLRRNEEPQRAVSAPAAIAEGDGVSPFPAYRDAELTLPASEEILDAALPIELGSMPEEIVDDALLTGNLIDEALPAMRGWDDEKPASFWLDEAARSAMESRVEWLEQEARLRADKTQRARGLLVCSELLATLGDREKAFSLAAEGRDVAPTVVLSHRQARALMSWPPDPDDHLEALDAEARAGPAGGARVHSMLLAVDALRMTGNDRAAGARVDEALRVAPGDSRVAVALAIRALSASGPAGSVSRLPDAPQVVAIARATASCLQLRGNDIKVATDPSIAANVLLMRTRQALDRGDMDGAITSLAALTRVPELALGAQWLAAALAATTGTQRKRAAKWLGELVEGGQKEALRPLLARAIELGDSDALLERMGRADTLTSPERVVLSALANRPLVRGDTHVGATAATADFQPLVSAVNTLTRSTVDDFGGDARSRTEIAIGQGLGASASSATLENMLRELGNDPPPAAWGIALENAVRDGRYDDVSRTIEWWATSRPTDGERAMGVHTAALVALRCGTPGRALEAFKVARSIDPGSEATRRAITALEPTDLGLELSALADEWGEGVRAALARIEAVERTRDSVDDATRLGMLERAYDAEPTLPIASFLAGRIARRAGNLDQALAWTRRRKIAATDRGEVAVETVREALLIGASDRTLAAECLLEAHLAYPMDVALRELLERLAVEAPSDRAAWMERRLSQTTGEAHTIVALEAAREYERLGDAEGALRCAAVADDAVPLARIARERAELGAGQLARMAGQLLTFVKEGSADAVSQREAYERLALLDATVGQDPASALLWHRTILEDHPLHLPSLRHAEHYFITEGRIDEIETVAGAIATSLRGTGAGECTAHAELAAHLRARMSSGGPPPAARDMVEIAFSEREPSLWALRRMATQARTDGDDATVLSALQTLADRASRPADAAALLARAADAALRYGDVDQARALLERAATQDPGDVRTWGLLAELRMRLGDAVGAAEAFEAVARSSGVASRRLSAWYEAGRLWADLAGDDLKAITALEAVSALDVDHADVSDRLIALYAGRQMHGELADHLERLIARTVEPERRLSLEVRRGRALLAHGDLGRARRAFEGALEVRPDEADALSALADLCIDQSDWEAAEQALVRLARLLPSREEQRRVYVRLSDLYSHHLLNLSRAEVALKEILKRDPEDLETTQRLIDIYKRQNDPTRAVELQQQLVVQATAPELRRARMLELAALQEGAARDPRRAEKTLEGARREFPQDMGLLRELAEFYQRHQQTPAVRILLDRAASDGRRAISAGDLSPSVLELLATVFDLRGKKDGTRVALGLLAALEGRSVDIRGAGDRALNPQLDDSLAPELLSPAIRALLAKTGDALDTAAPLNLRDLRATPAKSNAPMSQFATRVALGIELGGLQILTSPKLELSCIPVSSASPTIVMGEALAANERVGPFLVVRALKLVRSRASALMRFQPQELSVLIAAWMRCFNPSWRPKWAASTAVDVAYGKVRAALPRHLDPNLVALALEAGSAMEAAPLPLGSLAVDWADRAALLALGDPSAAFEAIAASSGEGADVRVSPPTWIAGNPEALGLAAFALSDAFLQARGRLGLDP